MSSSFAVSKVKRALLKASGEKQKVGHFGTLDPLASGVLPIAVGNATRLFDYAQEKVKVYQAIFRFGVETTTLDSEGEVTKTSNKTIIKEDVVKALGKFIGKINQLPPEYSAKSVNGKRAYELARSGKKVELKPKEIEIFDFKLIESNNSAVIFKDGEHHLEDNEFAFEISCGSGTYIRSLARDLAAEVGTVGYMSYLLRVQSGAFNIDNAVTVDEFEINPLKYILPIEFALKKYEVFDLPKNSEKHVLNGVSVAFDNLPNNEFVVKLDNRVIGIAENDNGKLKFKTKF